MPDFKRKVFDRETPPFERLVAIMAVLRSDDGCAWDRKQTHKSLLPYLIEEAYEVVEAVESGDDEMLREELGDLACQIAFHAQMAREKGAFDINDALESINEKLIKRHPHIFGSKRDLSPKQVRDQWEKIKVESGEKESVLAGVPRSMPALLMAYRIGEKAGGVGFDWKNAEEVFDKVDEELKEMRSELKSGDREKLEEELGDLLFALASLARKLEIDPEQSLKKALEKFRSRFSVLEETVAGSGRKFEDYTLDELEEIWQKSKSRSR
ncbi:MAG: nucleoside triphosphate pyrophosphohydrolase [Candidatus Zixiibacteriota bacterium]|nr:MAG: nucleoside triphosphate pyrophosphohydrolase [candidate division Zixibacteria bacterium]